MNDWLGPTEHVVQIDCMNVPMQTWLWPLWDDRGRCLQSILTVSLAAVFTIDSHTISAQLLRCCKPLRGAQSRHIDGQVSNGPWLGTIVWWEGIV